MKHGPGPTEIDKLPAEIVAKMDMANQNPECVEPFQILLHLWDMLRFKTYAVSPVFVDHGLLDDSSERLAPLRLTVTPHLMSTPSRVGVGVGVVVIVIPRMVEDALRKVCFLVGREKEVAKGANGQVLATFLLEPAVYATFGAEGRKIIDV